MDKKKSSEKYSQVQFSLECDEFEVLLLMAGVAIGFMFERGDKKLAYSFLRLANRLNENNPNWIPYAIPSDAEWEADSTSSPQKRG